MEKNDLEIIIVEDEPEIRELYVDVLDSIGYKNIKELENGSKAIEFIKKEAKKNPDSNRLYIIDLDLGTGPNGFDVTKKVHDLDKTALFYIASSQTGESHITKGYEDFLDTIREPATNEEPKRYLGRITKPVNINDFIKYVNIAFEKYNKRT